MTRLLDTFSYMEDLVVYQQLNFAWISIGVEKDTNSTTATRISYEDDETTTTNH